MIYNVVRKFFQLLVKKLLCLVRLLKLIVWLLLLKLKKIIFKLMMIIIIIVVILIIVNQNLILLYRCIVVKFVNVISLMVISVGIYCVIFGNQNWMQILMVVIFEILIVIYINQYDQVVRQLKKGFIYWWVYMVKELVIGFRKSIFFIECMMKKMNNLVMIYVSSIDGFVYLSVLVVFIKSLMLMVFLRVINLI